MKKIVALSVFSCVLLIACGDSKPRKINLELKPARTREYSMVLTSKKLNIETNLSCFYETGKDSITMYSILKKMNYSDGTPAFENEMRSYYDAYIDDTLATIFNRQGKILMDLNTQNIANTDMLVIEFPGKEIKVGDSWQGERAAKTEMVFSRVKTKYTCLKIMPKETIIRVEMDYIDDKKVEGLSLNKKQTGNYIIDNATGMVKNAQLEISGSNGFSPLKGHIEITSTTTANSPQ